MGLLTGQTVVEGDFKTTSAGAGDSGKVPKLNANGILDSSFLPFFKNLPIIEDANGSTNPVPVFLNPEGNLQVSEADVSGADKVTGFVTENISNITPTFVNASGGTSTTLSFTPGSGSNKVILVNIGLGKYNSPSFVYPTSVTWNGITMTEIDRQAYDTTPILTTGQITYILAIGSSTTTANIVVNGSTTEGITVQASCYKNIDQTTPIQSQAKSNNSGTSFTCALDPEAGTHIVSMIAYQVGSATTPMTFASSQTSRNNQLTPAFSGFYQYGYIGDVVNRFGANVTYNATVGSSVGWHHQVVALQSVGATTNLKLGGVISASGLTIGSKYYLSNTAGEISTSAGGTSVLVGKALSATELLIIQE